MSKPEYKTVSKSKPRRLIRKFKGKPRCGHYRFTSCHKPPKGFSCIKVWKHRTQQSIPTTCCFKACKNQLSRYNRVGAHICVEGFHRYVYKSIYIVPSCKSCNSKHGLFCRLKSPTPLVRVLRTKIGFYGAQFFIEIGSIDKGKVERLISKHDRKSAGLFRYYKKFTVQNKNIEDLKCKTI